MGPSDIRFLIAGAGYVGLRAAEYWHSQHNSVHAVTRSLSRADDFKQRGLKPVLLDLSSPPVPGITSPLPAADCVLWAVGLDRSSSVPREKIWIDGLNWLVNNLTKPPQRFIYVSSTSIYGAGDGASVDESTLLNPDTEGGECCVRAEHLLRNLCADLYPQTQVVVLRMAGIYGPDRLLRRIGDLQAETPLPGDPNSWLNLIHVEDAVRMIAHVATTAQVPKVVNVVNSGTVTRQQYYSRLAQLAGAPPPVFGGPARARGGNKRVTSTYCGASEAAEFLFDDVLKGLEHAVVNSDMNLLSR